MEPQSNLQIIYRYAATNKPTGVGPGRPTAQRAATTNNLRFQAELERAMGGLQTQWGLPNRALTRSPPWYNTPSHQYLMRNSQGASQGRDRSFEGGKGARAHPDSYQNLNCERWGNRNGHTTSVTTPLAQPPAQSPAPSPKTSRQRVGVEWNGQLHSDRKQPQSRKLLNNGIRFDKLHSSNFETPRNAKKPRKR